MEPQLPPGVLNEVCRAFRLGAARSVTYLREGRVNDNFLVHSDVGSYVLRRSHPGRTVEAVAFEHALIGYLSRRGFPTPPLRTMIGGASFLALDDELYRVTAFVPGERCRAGEDLRACARTLALYHRLVAGYGLPPRPGFVPIRDELAAGRSLLPPASSSLPGWIPALQAVLTATCARLTEAEPPPTVVAHASCRRESFVLRDGHVVAMLDYDNAHVDARTLDLAIALLSFAVVRPDKTVLDLDRASRFLAAYADVTPLVPAERAIIVWYMRARILKRALARYRDYRLVPRPSRATKLQLATRLLRWLDEHEEAIVSATSGNAEHVPA
ncbi:MAG: phosphotransferase [Actinomycetota bacterium]|nr:phosphotransferase [Actinomycetota bacterium]